MEKQVLSLDDMLKLAEKVKKWKYFPRYLEGMIVEYRYFGEVKGINIKVGEGYATPWGPVYRYIRANYGNLTIGEFPKTLNQNNRLDELYHSIPERMRQQGLRTVRKKLLTKRSRKKS